MAGLYIHIPYCRSKCIYCDFYSHTKLSEMEKTVDGLIQEYKYRRKEIEEPFNTIYIGGGTPSVLPTELLERLVSELDRTDAVEFTIEANPDNIRRGTVCIWKDLGINRVSLGVQTLDDKVLKSIGRRHSAKKALEAINIINDCGISNISADLIYGLPGIDEIAWEHDLKTLLSTPIKHLSAYCLTYNEGTMLYKMWQQGRVSPATDEEIENRFNALRRMTAEAGFEHYEISNFALPGFRSRHNSSYWSPESKWLGIGPSAHSFDGKVRRIDIPDTKAWNDQLPYPCEIDTEDELDMVNDYIVTGLRTLDGLEIERIPEKYRARLLNEAAGFIKEGSIVLNNGRMSINPEKWLISDSYIRELIIID